MTAANRSYARRIYAAWRSMVPQPQARRLLEDYVRRRDEPLTPPPAGWSPDLGIHSGIELAEHMRD